LALDRSVWDGVVARLKDEAEMLTFDCRGHGRSPRTPGPYTAQIFARDLAELLDHIRWDRAGVAAWSMGGNVAQAFASEHPARVSAVVLVGPPAGRGAGAWEKLEDRPDLPGTNGLRSMIDFQLTR